MVNMQMTKQGYIELSSYEGVSTTPYLDSVGVKTIGIGNTASDIPDLDKWPWTKSITVAQAFAFFTLSTQRYVDAVNKALKVPVTDYQFDALCSITYNIGTHGMANSSFIRDINAGRPIADVVAAIKMWNKPPEIKGRRSREATLFKNGTYSNNGLITLI